MDRTVVVAWRAVEDLQRIWRWPRPAFGDVYGVTVLAFITGTLHDSVVNKVDASPLTYCLSGRAGFANRRIDSPLMVGSALCPWTVIRSGLMRRTHASQSPSRLFISRCFTDPCRAHARRGSATTSSLPGLMERSTSADELCHQPEAPRKTLHTQPFLRKGPFLTGQG